METKTNDVRRLKATCKTFKPTFSDLKRDNGKHRFVIAKSVGAGLGKIENKPVSWRGLKKKLSLPLHDITCMFADYEDMSVDEKLKKKRAPGSWTPSEYKGKNRHVADLKFKTLIVYDLDHITQDQLDWIRTGMAPICGWAWFMHTTRSHCPESPRVRLVVPVSRSMLPDEAHAVFRFLALELADDPEEAIEIPDLVSFRGNQTMFWPSHSRDQEFWSDENVAPILDVDAFLALPAHKDWDDFENLPYAAGESKHGKTDPNKRMDDPWEKLEPIGAFCRAYTVQEVIERWLPDVYEACDAAGGQERYTYLLGTASSGAVVYEDGKFLHSNHGSDPVTTCNAFDLLRLHKFGELDAGSHANTSPGNMPSYKAMIEFAGHDLRVVAEMNSHQDDLVAQLEELEDEDPRPNPKLVAKAKMEAKKLADPEMEDLLGPEPESDDPAGDMLEDLESLAEGEDDADAKVKAHAWRLNLRYKKDKTLDGAVLSNVVLIAENDPRLRDRIGYNLFTNEPVCFKQIRTPGITLTSEKVLKSDRRYGRDWQDKDDLAVRMILSANEDRKGYATEFTDKNVQDAVLAAGMQQAFHPIQDLFKDYHAQYVASGRKSKGAIAQIPQTYLGCPDDAYHRESSRILMIALCARVFEPGCKFDVVTIIRGGQGGRKSEFWRVLAHDFFSELPKNFDKTDRMVEAMKGNLISEMGEMAGLRRETAEEAKEFITRQTDKIRLAYARRVGKYKRTSVLTGTSNLSEILHDPTGNRRFWIWVDHHDENDPIDMEAFRAAIPMLWGEAYDEYLAWRVRQPHGPLWLDLQNHESRRLRDELADQVRARTAVEVVADLIAEWLDEERVADEVPDFEDDTRNDWTRMVVRSMTCASDAMDELHSSPTMRGFPRFTPVHYGHSLSLLVNRGLLVQHKRCRAHDKNVAWFTRRGVLPQDPRWMDAAPLFADGEIDELLS